LVVKTALGLLGPMQEPPPVTPPAGGVINVQPMDPNAKSYIRPWWIGVDVQWIRPQ